MRRFLAIAFLSAALGGLTLPTAPSKAGVDIDINIGIGTIIGGGRRISCSEGAWLLRDRGFRAIRMLDCRGKHYAYTGWRRGRQFEIVIRSRNGYIVGIRRIA